VLRFDFEGMAPVPADQVVWQPRRDLLELPRGVTPLEDALAPDVAPIVFGLGHTDSNQHVNSLAYPRIFEEAALRRFASLGLATRLMPRYFDIAYRKPCFAGERMRVILRAYRDGEQVGVVGSLVADDVTASPARLAAASPHCFARMQFGG
jgi:hypothetical protein